MDVACGCAQELKSTTARKQDKIQLLSTLKKGAEQKAQDTMLIMAHPQDFKRVQGEVAELKQKLAFAQTLPKKYKGMFAACSEENAQLRKDMQAVQEQLVIKGDEITRWEMRCSDLASQLEASHSHRVRAVEDLSLRLKTQDSELDFGASPHKFPEFSITRSISSSGVGTPRGGSTPRAFKSSSTPRT